MATRAPTSFSAYAWPYFPRKPILADPADNMYDDQQFVLDHNDMVIGDQFPHVSDSTVSGSWVTVRRYYTRAPQYCGTKATVNCQWSFLTWCDGPPTNYQVAIYHNGRAVRHAYTVSASHTSHIWRAWSTAVLYGDGTENELFIQVNNPADASNDAIHIAGVALFTNF